MLSKEVEILWRKQLLPGEPFFELAVSFVEYGFINVCLESLPTARRQVAGKSLKAIASMKVARDSIQSREPQKLLQLLMDSRPCNASDSRDKIFALSCFSIRC